MWLTASYVSTRPVSDRPPAPPPPPSITPLHKMDKLPERVTPTPSQPRAIDSGEWCLSVTCSRRLGLGAFCQGNPQSLMCGGVSGEVLLPPEGLGERCPDSDFGRVDGQSLYHDLTPGYGVPRGPGPAFNWHRPPKDGIWSPSRDSLSPYLPTPEWSPAARTSQTEELLLRASRLLLVPDRPPRRPPRCWVLHGHY